MDGLALRLLGGIGASRGGVEVDLGGRLQRTVLAVLLAARRRAVAGDRLVDLLWPQAPPANAVATLQSYVSHLRRRLEPERSARERHGILRSGAGGYSLHLPDEAVDAWHFEQLVTSAARESDPGGEAEVLRRALALWSGPAYAEYRGQSWADAEAARWDELHDLAVDRLLEARLELEPPGLLVADLEAAVGQAPLREQRWRLLALALYRAQRQADALGAIRRARETLVEELGVDPGSALQELEAQLLTQDPSLQPRFETAAPIETRDRPLRVPDDLFDREAEIAQLDAVLHATAIHGAVVLIEGPAGIGKTRLLAEARRRAADGQSTVLSARGSQMEQQFAFGAVRQLFEPLVAGEPQLLAGAAEAARAVFEVSASPERPETVFAALHGLYWLSLNASARRPLLLCVDDLQWCDSGSLRFFSYLARRLEGTPVSIAATLRTGEAFADPALISELQHEPATTTIRPGPLSLFGVGQLVRRRLGAHADARFIAACHQSTRGNPLLLQQVLRALEADRVAPDRAHADVVTAVGSRAVASLVLARLNRLPEVAKEICRAVAVLGDDAPLAAAAALAGVSEHTAAEAVAVLVRQDLLQDRHPLAFVHPLIREAVYGDIPAVMRQVQHDHSARALDVAGAQPENVAAHLLHVPPRRDPWVCDVLRQAARVAADRGTPESAAAYLRRALDEPPPDPLLPLTMLELGGVENLRDGPSAVRSLRQAHELLPPGPQRSELAQVLTQALVFTGEAGEATQFGYERLLEAESGSDEYQGLFALARIAAFMHGVDADYLPAAAEISGTGPGARRLAATKAWDLVIDGTARDEAVRLARFALADGVLREVDSGLLWVVAAVVLDYADADIGDFWSRARDKALAEGSLIGMLSVHLWWGHISARAGDLREAQMLLSLAGEQSRAWGNVVGGAYFDAFHAEVLLDRGDVLGARSVVDAKSAGGGFGDGQRLFQQAECDVLIAEREFERALRLSDEIAPAAQRIINPIHSRWHEQRAAILSGIGRIGDAIAMAHEAVARSRAWGAPRQVGAALLQLGRVPGEHSESALREAIDVLAPTTALVPLVRAQLALSQLLGQTDEAAELLRQARANADTAGANGLRQACDELLAQRGEHPAQGLPRLSNFERRIAEMSLAGADERDIAQALLLTPHAIEVALAQISDRVGGGPERLAAVLAGG